MACKAKSTGIAAATASIFNAAGRKKKATKITSGDRGVYNVEQVADAGVSLFGEAAKVMGSSSPTKKADKTSAHKTPFNDTTIKLASPDLLKNRRSTLSQSGQLSPKQVEDISNFLKGGY